MSMSMGASKRGRAKIRPPPKKPGLDSSINDTWTKLAHAIREIQNHNASKLSFELHYRYAYNMVLFKHGEMLYSGVKKLIAEHLAKLAEDKIVPTFPRSSVSSGAGKLGGGAEAVERGVEGDRFLKALKSVWEDHTGSMRKLRDVLRYMDKVYTVSAGIPVTYDLGLSLFLSNIVRSPTEPIYTHLLSTLLSQVQLERDGETINRSTVRECVDILLRLTPGNVDGGVNVYQEDFEPVFLKRSEEFYRVEAELLLESCDAVVYLRKVEARLREEADRTVNYLASPTFQPLQDICVQNLLTSHLSTILEMPGSGLVVMLDNKQVGDLNRLYTLFAKVPQNAGLDALKAGLRRTIAERGKMINQGVGSSADDKGEPGMDVDETQEDIKGKGKAKPKEVGSGASALNAALRWVQEVLDLKDKFDTVLLDAFEDDKAIQTAINEAFQSFIHANPKAPEFISLFLDDNLKKGAKNKSDAEIEVALEKTIILFRFLSDKDVFERYYKNHLARRLLHGRSASDDAERGMVAKLKVEMGFQFTQKLEGMFNDMRISAESAQAFRDYQNRSSALPLELTVTVLTASYWPPQIVAPTTCRFSGDLSKALEVFHKFYDGRHSGRRLTWQSNLGTADVRVRFKSRAHDLNLSTQALAVLLLFEDVRGDDFLTFKDIRAATDLPDADLQRSLQSLACGKYRVLTKHPKGRDVNATDQFTFNDAFVCPLARIKIAQVVSKVETPKERNETQEMVDEERKHQVEACIVRIMKDRKTMAHNSLVSEVAHQLSARFAPSVPMIKKRIEGLIDREYLERGSEINTYRYLA